MYEHRKEPLVPRAIFIRRVGRSLSAAIALIMVSLGAGMVGYHSFEELSWTDSFIEAAMILSGMGPIATLHTTSGKIFAGCYALYSGLMLILIVGIIIAPIAHRFFHRFHLEIDDKD